MNEVGLLFTKASLFRLQLLREGTGTSPVWGCDDSARGKNEDQEASYRPEYTGSFITEWEIPYESDESGIRNNPGHDFVVDWIN